MVSQSFHFRSIDTPKVMFHRSHSIIETYQTFLLPPLLTSRLLLCLIKLLIQQMQQKVDIQLEVPFKQRHELMALKLRL